MKGGKVFVCWRFEIFIYVMHDLKNEPVCTLGKLYLPITEIRIEAKMKENDQPKKGKLSICAVAHLYTYTFSIYISAGYTHFCAQQNEILIKLHLDNTQV